VESEARKAILAAIHGASTMGAAAMIAALGSLIGTAIYGHRVSVEEKDET
jgi:hypothetical protein